MNRRLEVLVPIQLFRINDCVGEEGICSWVTVGRGRKVVSSKFLVYLFVVEKIASRDCGRLFTTL